MENPIAVSDSSLVHENEWNYTRDYTVPIWVFMPSNSSALMGIKFAPAILSCTAECFCSSAKGLNRQLRFLRKDVENVNQKQSLELVAVLTALTMHAASDRCSDRLQQRPG